MKTNNFFLVDYSELLYQFKFLEKTKNLSKRDTDFVLLDKNRIYEEIDRLQKLA